MVKKALLFIVVVVFACWFVLLAQPKFKQIERGKEIDLKPTWYFFDWAANAPYAPVFHVLDTESSLGRYAKRTKAITLKDLVKFHGHLCDGLVTAAVALNLGFKVLYPEGVIDRTDTGCVTNNSPCFGDVAAYLTGGRIRFGTQKINPQMGNEFILYRFSTKEAVHIAMKPGVFPDELIQLERQIRSGNFAPSDIDRCQKMQWDFARKVLNTPPEQLFTVEKVPDFVWEPDEYPNRGIRGDILLKNAP
jgi:formylmethanofuran dehydrogenase subunit E